jgi:hypothetical protein
MTGLSRSGFGVGLRVFLIHFCNVGAALPSFACEDLVAVILRACYIAVRVWSCIVVSEPWAACARWSQKLCCSLLIIRMQC